MHFPLNRVVLRALADVDFLAALALTGTSATLRMFIFEEVLTISTLARFLHENQYVLRHDVYHTCFSDKEIASIHTAFTALQQRHGDELYHATVGSLGALISRTPLTVFRKFPCIPNEFEECYELSFSESWMHRPEDLYDNSDRPDSFFRFHAETQNEFLREEFLFCKRYLDDFHACCSVIEIMPRVCARKAGNDYMALAAISDIRKKCHDCNITPLFEKRCIQGAMKTTVRPMPGKPKTISPSTFRALFELPGWMELWAPDELGWWYAIGLSQYGLECVASLIDQSFETKREALLWIFLSTHNWFQGTVLKDDENERTPISCCRGKHAYHEQVDVNGLLESMSVADRRWILQQAIRRAPQFGICRNLGSYLFTYFVVRDYTEADMMLSLLINEISTSPLQYLFEFSISMAIKYYEAQDENVRVKFTVASTNRNKLIRKNLRLYTLLTSEMNLATLETNSRT